MLNKITNYLFGLHYDEIQTTDLIWALTPYVVLIGSVVLWGIIYV